MCRCCVALVAILAAVLLTGPAALGMGLHSIGLRAVLPVGNAPPLLGLEASGDLAFGLLTGSLLLSGSGKTLLTVSCDVQVGDEAGLATTYVRLTTGLAYFDPSLALPRLVFGGGLSFEISVSPVLAAAAAGEFIYPFAFPVPMISTSGRWVLP